MDEGRAALKQQLEAVGALSREREQIMKQRSPELMAETLKAKAQEADHRAQEMVSEAVDSADRMDAGALSELRQRFVQEKMEKHWRLAVKASLEQGAPAAASAP
uniref:Uncharacterized protein n=1 Tax=Alexandrium andersonii TaxID=327968 RepID=A0A7S2C8T9_9DINO